MQPNKNLQNTQPSTPVEHSGHRLAAGTLAVGLAATSLLSATLNPDHAPKPTVIAAHTERHAVTLTPPKPAETPTPISPTSLLPKKQAHHTVSIAAEYKPDPALLGALQGSTPKSETVVYHAPVVTKKHHEKVVHYDPKPPVTKTPLLKHPVHATHHPKSEKMPKPVTLHPDLLSVTPEAQTNFNRDAAYIPAFRCSALIIRDPATDTPIGAITARHCLTDELTTGFDGTTVLNLNQPFIVQTGKTIDQLTTVGEVTQIVINPATDDSKDEVVAVFKDQTPNTVLTQYASEHMSVDEANKLKLGDTVFDAGWPVDQPDNHGPEERQDFAMTVLGTATWDVEGGLYPNLLVTAVPKDADGAICSPGNSGSVAFKLEHTTLPDGTIVTIRRLIGSQTAYASFEASDTLSEADALANQQYYEAYYGISLAGYKGVCGYALVAPSSANNMITVGVNVYHTSDPGKGGNPAPQPPQSPTAPEGNPIADAESRFKQEFNDPTVTKQVINGYVQVLDGAKTQGGFYDGAAAFYDKTTDTTLLAYNKANNEIGFVPLPGQGSLQAIQIYNRGPNQPAQIENTSGVITAVNTIRSAYYEDTKGLKFGQQLLLGSVNTLGGIVSNLQVTNGQISLQTPKTQAVFTNNSPADDRQIAIGELFDSINDTRQVLQGTVSIPGTKSNIPTVLKDPDVYYDADNKNVTMTFFETNPTGSDVGTLTEPLSQLQVTPDDGQTTVQLIPIDGATIFHNDPTGVTEGYITDEVGTKFSEVLVNPQPISPAAPVYNVTYGASGLMANQAPSSAPAPTPSPITIPPIPTPIPPQPIDSSTPTASASPSTTSSS